MTRKLLLLIAPVLLALQTGCSVRKMAVDLMADALAASGQTFASDDDPELIEAASPFSLKLMESLLQETPTNKDLLLATARGFTQYSYGFVVQEADRIEGEDFQAADTARSRARRLYLRARDYGLRGLDVAHKDFSRILRQDPRAAVRRAHRRDVPLLYWTAVAWAG